jgi:16S rRNA (cytidine1402-2'-O)-methyltransferase
MPGTLFVVATPIGNLEDLSFRALRTLKEVDVIAAEDTRRTAKLLAHYEVRKPMVSLHAHNEYREASRLVGRLDRGESIALVTDAGTPGISDPGAHLVKLARQRGLKVSPIPGPSAVMAALSTSGLPADQFLFLGFPPRGGSDRRLWLERVKAERSAVVMFEAPHRIRQTVGELTQLLADRPIHLYRELTKINEKLVEYTNMPIDSIPSLGEFVVVIGHKSTDIAADKPDPDVVAKGMALVGCITKNCNVELDEATKLVAKSLDLDAQVVRKAFKKHRIAVNQRRQALS